jgi:hypothetical protein
MTAGLVCFPGARSGRNPIDHVQRRIPDLEKVEIQKAPGRHVGVGVTPGAPYVPCPCLWLCRLESFPQIS